MKDNELDALRKQNAELLEALRPFAEAYEPLAESDRRWVNMTDVERAALDGNTITPCMTVGEFRRAYEAVATAAQSAPASTPDWISYDATNDVLTIHGIRYSGELMRDFSEAMPCGQPFEIVEREHGILAVRRLDRPAAANADDRIPDAECAQGSCMRMTTGCRGKCSLSGLAVPIVIPDSPAAEKAPASNADARESGCRMTGGICACRSGGSFGGCAKERAYCCTNEPARPAAVGAGGQHD